MLLIISILWRQYGTLSDEFVVRSMYHYSILWAIIPDKVPARGIRYYLALKTVENHR